MSNPYDPILPPTRLDKAVDAAIQESNQAFLADERAIQAAREDGDRWRQIDEAKQAVGHHGVVLPTALAQDLLRIVRGEQPRLRESLVEAMLQQHLDASAALIPASQED